MKNLFVYVLSIILVALVIPAGFSYVYYPSTYAYPTYTSYSYSNTYTTNTYTEAYSGHPSNYYYGYYPTTYQPAQAYYVPVVNYSPVYTFPFTYYVNSYVNGVPVNQAYGYNNYVGYNNGYVSAYYTW